MTSGARSGEEERSDDSAQARVESSVCVLVGGDDHPPMFHVKHVSRNPARAERAAGSRHALGCLASSLRSVARLASA